ncbi:MAG: PA-phosphatase like phosphoesterase [Flaviaesturariibacter sp.]|nr:PA-phosphatase like phosphoesterase [Flaviaesturariibacter sp.]
MAVWAGGLTVNDFFTNQLKEGFQRHLPNSGDAYNLFDGPGGPKVNKSMPSAHTSNAFATASAFATVYQNMKWVPPVAYGLASLVGISRIYSNAHWASDVLVGAGVGYLSTKLSYWVYEKANRWNKKRTRKAP